MNFFVEHHLTVMIFVPFVGALLALSFPPNNHAGVRGFGLAVAFIGLALTAWMWARFDPSLTGFQLTEGVDWVTSLRIRYSVGVDGLSVLPTLVAALLAPLVILSVRETIGHRTKEYIVCGLITQGSIVGALLSTNVFLFYVFGEVAAVSIFFMIGIWGGAKRVRAAKKFVLFQLAGSMALLVTLVFTVWLGSAGDPTFEWAELARRLDHADLHGIDLHGIEPMLFGGFVFAFAIKSGALPFYSWLRDAHGEGPVGASILVSGLIVNLALVGLLRCGYGLFPQAALRAMPLIAGLAVTGIVIAAFSIMVRTNLKHVVAYITLTQVSIALLGISVATSASLTGTLMLMLSHSLASTSLCVVAGALYRRFRSHDVSELGGLARIMPWAATTWVLAVLCVIGVPGLSGFVGYLLVLHGTFSAQIDKIGPAASPGALMSHWGVYASVALVLFAAGLLALTRRLLFVPSASKPESSVQDLSVRERVVLVPLVAAIILVGVYPGYFTDIIEPSVATFAGSIHRRGSLARVPARTPDSPSRVSPSAPSPMPFGVQRRVVRPRPRYERLAPMQRRSR